VKKSAQKGGIPVCLLLVAIVTVVASTSFLRKPEELHSTLAPDRSTPSELSGKALNAAILDQEDKVDRRRGKLAYFAGEAKMQEYVQVDNTRAIEEFILAAYVEQFNLKNLISYLSQEEGDPLHEAATYIVPANSKLKVIYQKISEKKDLQLSKINKFGSDSPDIAVRAQAIQILQVQLEDEILNLRKSLEAKLDQVNLVLQGGYSSAAEHFSKKHADVCTMRMPSYADALENYTNDLERLLELKAIKKRLTSDPSLYEK
jgi:hypothetical protein